MNEKLLTPEQVAERLQVTERTVYGWLRRGRLPALKLGRLWRIRPADLEAFLESARTKAHNISLGAFASQAEGRGFEPRLPLQIRFPCLLVPKRWPSSCRLYGHL